MTAQVVILRDTDSPEVILRDPKFAIVPLASSDSAAAHRAVLEAMAQADRSEDEADRSEVARSGAEAAEAGTLAAISGVSLSNATLNAATRVVLAALDTTLGLPAFLTEAGRVGLFKWTTGNHAAHIALDTDQGIYIESDSIAATSGAWVRQFEGDAFANWFGVGPAFSAAVNTAALNQAIAVLKTYFAVTGIGYSTGSRRLRIQAGVHELNDTIDIDHAISIIGDFTGMFSGGGTILEWTVSCDGISVEKTVGYCHLEGLGLYGIATVGSGKHGIKARGKCIGQRMFIEGFDHGIDCYGTFAIDGTNTNGSHWSDIAIQGCGWATWSEGADANNMKFDNVSGIANLLGGHMDLSFLGNIYDGGDCSANGLSSSYKSRSEKNGHHYAVAFGQEAWCSANSPSGTTAHNQGWIYIGESSLYYSTTWVGGQTWYFSAPYSKPSEGNARSRFRDIYVELDQNPCVCNWPSLVYTGQQFVAVIFPNGNPYGGVLEGSGDDGGIQVQGNFHAGQVITSGTTPFHGEVTAADLSTHAFDLVTDIGLAAGNWGLRVRRTSDGVAIPLWVQAESLELFNGSAWTAKLTHAGFDTTQNYKVNGVQVVGSQQAALPDATPITARPVEWTDINALTGYINEILARLRAHGLIDT